MNELDAEFERIRMACWRAYQLLNDPHMGLITWNIQLNQAVIEVQAALCSAGATPEACEVKL